MGCRDITSVIFLTFVELEFSLQNCKLYITLSKRFSFY